MNFFLVDGTLLLNNCFILNFKDSLQKTFTFAWKREGERERERERERQGKRERKKGKEREREGKRERTTTKKRAKLYIVLNFMNQHVFVFSAVCFDPIVI